MNYKKNSLNIDRLLFFGKISLQTQLLFLTGTAIIVFCFAEDFLLQMVWLDAMGFDRIQWNGAAGALILKEVSSQGYYLSFLGLRRWLLA